MPLLKVVQNGLSHSGKIVQSYKLNEAKRPVLVGKIPQIGCVLAVGNHSPYDFWATTDIIEIIKTDGNYFRFKTLNNEYEFWIDENVNLP